MRAAKAAAWSALSQEERKRRLAEWKPQCEKNKAYYAASRAVMQDIIMELNNHVGGPYKFRVEVMEKDDPLIPTTDEEPWLSGKTHWYRVIPLDMENQEARVHAQKRAAERGLAAQARSQGDDTEHPTFQDEPKEASP